MITRNLMGCASRLRKRLNGVHTWALARRKNMSWMWNVCSSKWKVAFVSRLLTRIKKRFATPNKFPAFQKSTSYSKRLQLTKVECPHFGCGSFEVFVSSVDEHGVFEDSGCVAPAPFRGHHSLRSTEFPPGLLLKNKSTMILENIPYCWLGILAE